MTRIRRSKKTSLAIVEKASRGALEEQYGNIVWLSECMKSMGAKHNLLMCGSAVTACFASQQQQTLLIGSLEISSVSHFAASVKSLLAKGARIWVLKEDLKKFGDQFTLIEGVEIADSMSALCLEHDKVWFW